MKALWKKWKSSQGASILMALLFLLVCMMVGASVLMAAASNAGKIRSNREEQQRYLTLSSALTLICDELESVEYVGKYRYGYVLVQRQEIKGYDVEDNPIWTWVDDHVRHYYWQEPGEIRRKDGAPWELNNTLPLYNDLDIRFAGQFEVPIGQRSPIDEYFYDTLETGIIQPTSPHTLELAVTDSGYGGLSEPVTVTIQLRNDGGVLVTAALKNHPEYIMEALLKPSGKPENVIVLSASPAKQTNFGVERETPPTVEQDKAEVNETLNKLTWTLEHIVKKEAGGT